MAQEGEEDRGVISVTQTSEREEKQNTNIPLDKIYHRKTTETQRDESQDEKLIFTHKEL